MHFLAIAFFQAGIDRVIDFAPPVTSLSRLCEAFGDSLKITVKPSDEVAREIIGIEAHKVTGRELLIRVAASIDADLKETGSGWEITRDDDQRSKRAERQIQNQMELMKEAIGRLASADPAFDATTSKKVAALVGAEWLRLEAGYDDEPLAKLRELEKRTPGGRFTLACLKALPLEDLGRLKRREEVVYARHPTRRQKRLPTEIASLVETFRRDQDQYANAIKPYFDRRRDKGGFGGLATEFTKPIGAVGDIIVKVSSLMYGGWACTVLGIGPKGEKTFLTQVFFSANSQAPSSETNPLVKATAEQDEFRKAVANVLSQQPIPVSPAVSATLLQADGVDPLDVYARPALHAVSSIRGKNVVVIGDDNLFGLLNRVWAKSEVRLSKIDEALGSGEREATDLGNWTVFRSRMPLRDAQETCDRTLLLSLLKRCAGSGELRLDDHAKFVLQHPRAERLPLLKTAVLLVAPRAKTSDFPYDGDLHGLRVFGMIDQSTRERMASGETFPISLWSPMLKKEVETWTFCANPNLSYTFSVGEPDRDENGFDISTSRLGKMEPTIVCPDGLPADTFLRFRAARTDSIFLWKLVQPGEYNEGVEAADVNRIGALLSLSSDPRYRMPSQDRFRFKPGRMEQWEIFGPLTENIGLYTSLRDDRLSAGPFLTLGQLPENTRKEIEAARQATIAPAQGKRPPP